MQLNTSQAGIFGKVPAHGDFIVRGFPNSFVTPWDEWLQRCVHGSQEIIGENWLNLFLNSPIWRFALTSGCVDNSTWAGILIPSVDSVGRYFPLTLAMSLNNQSNLFEIQGESGQEFYKALESVALDALHQNLNADSILDRMSGVTAPMTSGSLSGVHNDSGAIIIQHSESPNMEGHFATLLNYLHTQQNPSYSLWWSGGSNLLKATSIICPSLPTPNQYANMIGGQWTNTPN